MKIYNQYAEGVLSGEIITNEYIQGTVKRHMNDLDRSRRGDMPWRFSEPHADHMINFMQKLKHVSGRLAKNKENLILAPFQQFTWAMASGWIGPHEDTGETVRRFTKTYNERARKGGKSTEVAAVLCYGLLADGEEGAEVYSAATTMKQAKVVFTMGRQMLLKFKKDYPLFRTDIELLKENITYHLTGSKFEPLPNEPDTLDGSSPHFVSLDEMHAHKNDEMLKVMETGMGGRDNPLLIVITTAGKNINGPCYQMRKTNIDIIRGIKKDDRSMSMIYTIDEDDDWHDETVWIKSNPNIGIAPYWSYMRDQFNKAIAEGDSAENQFKMKNLNIWTTTGTTWIKDDEWIKSYTKDWTWEDMIGRPCHIGMDLSQYHDLTALILIFPPHKGDEKFRVLCKFYTPEDNMEKRKMSDGVDYPSWAKEGYIKAIPGPAIDTDVLLEDLKELRGMFDIQQLAYDRALAYKLVQEVKNLGIECIDYQQNCQWMNAPIIEIEKQISLQNLDHGNHPVLRWNVSNVALYIDTDGRKRFDKRKVVERIDGCVAMAMAMGSYLMQGAAPISKYETQELQGI